jgi:hypothetical protein
MDNIVRFIINISGNAQDEINEIGEAANSATGKVDGFMSVVQKIRDIGLAVQAVTGFFEGLTSSVQGLKDAYIESSITETKLAAVMRNTMFATREEIDSILELAEAQSKLGVVGGGEMLGGAQELATYLTSTESLKKLTPVMNDMLAQQYGLNASQEQAVQIGSMLGKVMQGQTGALSRYGYTFDKVQENILKHGTEAERAAVLYDVISESVGGVNAALAATPEGRLKQQADSMDDLRERMGKLVVDIQSALSPIFEKVVELVDKIITKFENYRETIMNVASIVANVLSRAMSVLWGTITSVVQAVMWFINGVREGSPVFVAAATVIIGLTTAIVAYKTVVGVITIATSIWAAVQAGLNIVLMLNPIGLIIAGIVALIAIIVFLAVKIKGWGTLWEAVIGFMKNTGLAFVESIKLAFDSMHSGIIIALDKIRIGWYEFKNAVGLGDETENNAMIAKIHGDVEARKQALVDSAKKVAEYSTAAVKSFDKVNLSWDSSITFKSTIDKLKSHLSPDPSPVGRGADSYSSTTTNSISSLSQDLSSASSSISAGGKSVKNFNITINDGLIKQVDNHFGSASETPESASDFMWRLSNALQMILNDVNYVSN